MFNNSYFSRYFADRYFPPIGAEPTPIAVIINLVGILNQDADLVGRRVGDPDLIGAYLPSVGV